MKRATLTEAKNNLSALVEQVQHGETRLGSALGEGNDPNVRVARLECQGLLRRASAPLPREILMTPPPRPSEGASVLDALLDERRDER
jgi:hypothetical protein